MKIAAKEADETEYWLLLCKETGNYHQNKELLEKVNTIIKILTKIISSPKKT
jgi:four helix bundle protein